jgi:hypothetical protein
MTQRIDLDLAGLRQLNARIESQELLSSDWRVFSALVTALADRAEARLARMIAKVLADEAAAAGAKAAGTGPSALDVKHNSAGDAESADAKSSSIIEPDDPVPTNNGPATGGGAGKDPPKKKYPGHGRNGASAYTNAKHIYHVLLAGVIGALCKYCKAGPVSRYREKVIVRVIGQPIFGAELHHFEQGRCKLCGRTARAAVPNEVTAGIGSTYVNYDWSACAMLGVMHYFAHMPFKRLESLQKGWGIPVADANQWDVVKKSDELLLPLFSALEKHGIQQAETVRIDDTGSKVIEIQRQINAEIKSLEVAGKSIDKVRTGINATGVYLETPEGTVILYYTGLHHAGEIFSKLLVIRRSATTERLVKITDAASKNFDADQAGETIEAVCNAHAMVNFYDIKDKYPAEYAIVGAAYKQIFDNDDIAKTRKMTPVERMVFHKEHSLPLMEGIKAMCEEKIKGKLVEPRSPLWGAVTFIVNQWSKLTKFCHQPGVPLDTNLVEQKLIIPVRYLAASFNYHTSNGAQVGDRYMSLVVTACENEVAPVEYLTHCLENHEDLAKRPEHYLPWVYRDRMEDQQAELPDKRSAQQS